MSHTQRYEAVRAAFLKDVGRHQLEILNDSGVFRTLLLKRPDSGIYHFYITTWPGHLAISGDAGSMTFKRLHDMFEFFRDRRGELSINASYWHEKLVATDRRSPPEAFSYDAFRRGVIEDYRSWRRHHRDAADMTREQHKDLREALRGLLRDTDLNEQEARRQLYDFRFRYYEPSDRSRTRARYANPFNDVVERRMTEYTDHFLWQCFAVAWAVQQYDQAKASSRPVEREAAAVDLVVS